MLEGGLEAARQLYVQRHTFHGTREQRSLLYSIKTHTVPKTYFSVPPKEVSRCCKSRYDTTGETYFHIISAEHIAMLYDVDPEEVLQAQAAVDIIMQLKGVES